MALKLRLSRAGSKKRPYYHVVVADARSPRDGRFIEQVGHYNPMLPKDSEDRVSLNKERVEHWLSVGAQPTDRVLRFLDAEGILKREPRNNPQKAEPGAKAKERAQERADAEAAKAEAAAAPAEEEAPAEEAPAEEAAAEAPAEEAPAAADADDSEEKADA